MADNWVYDTEAAAVRIRDAFQVAADYPKKGIPRTPGIHGPIPDTFTSGAPGWTEFLVDWNSGVRGLATKYMLRRSRLTRAHEGKTVRSKGEDVVLPEEKDAVADDGGPWTPRPSAAAVLGAGIGRG